MFENHPQSQVETDPSRGISKAVSKQRATHFSPQTALHHTAVIEASTKRRGVKALAKAIDADHHYWR